MEVIHSDCSFVDDFSQNHFNMKLHYGFLFFDYLFKFILQLTKKFDGICFSSNFMISCIQKSELMFENTSGMTEMVERERKNERIKAYARNDLAFGFYCSKTAEFIKQFPDGNECHDINDALEEYNVVKIITTPGIKTFDPENLSRWIKNIKKSYFSYFQRICDDNIIVEEYSRVNCLYFEDFWDMFELGCLYDRISIDSIGQILALENGHALFYVLQHKKIVKKYDAFLRAYMLALLRPDYN